MQEFRLKNMQLFYTVMHAWILLIEIKIQIASSRNDLIQCKKIKADTCRDVFEEEEEKHLTAALLPLPWCVRMFETNEQLFSLTISFQKKF